MRVLALDTTTRAGSIALVEDDRIVDVLAGVNVAVKGESEVISRVVFQ